MKTKVQTNSIIGIKWLKTEVMCASVINFSYKVR